MQKIIRQGDVLVVPCNAIPAAARPVEAEADRFILARGEATGHHHSIALSPRVAMFRDDGGAGGRTYLRVEEAAALVHQEHTALQVAPGNYEVRIQRTFQAGMARRVTD
jgi:hypothetical protein